MAKKKEQTQTVQAVTMDYPWMRHGTDVEGVRSAREAIEKAKLNWEVELKPLCIADEKHPWPVPRMAVVRKDLFMNKVLVEAPNPVLGVVGASYVPVQNIRLFDFLNPMLSNKQASIIRAGTVDQDRRIWMIAKLTESLTVEKDRVEEFMLLVSSHDGTNAVKVRAMPLRILCLNQLTAGFAFRMNRGRGGDGDEGNEFLISVKHTFGAEERLAMAGKVLDLLNKQFKSAGEVYRSMFRKKIASKEVKGYIKDIFPDRPSSKSNERREKLRNNIYEIYETSDTITPIRGTVWGAYNTVTQYVTHGRERFEKKSSDTRIKSLWFGGGRKIGNRAFTRAIALLK